MGKRTQVLWVGPESVAPMTVDQRSTFVGVHEVFDLSVDHPLHNFVANDVLVHNKQNPALCYLPDHTVTENNEVCTCTGGGKGHVECTGAGSAATCVSCDTPDSGM